MKDVEKLIEVLTKWYMAQTIFMNQAFLCVDKWKETQPELSNELSDPIDWVVHEERFLDRIDYLKRFIGSSFDVTTKLKNGKKIPNDHYNIK